MSKFDVFQWANQVEEYKNNVSCELFLFNKNYTPFKVRYSDKLTANVKAMFMMEAVTYVNKEADKGLEQKEYELSDGDSNVVYRTDLSNVTRAESLINLIEKDKRVMNPDVAIAFVDIVKKFLGYDISLSLDAFLRVQLRELKR
jgi:hypothetical protein